MRLMRFRYDLLGIASVLIIAILFLFSGTIAIYIFSKTHNVAVSYKDLRVSFLNGLVFNDLNVHDNATGLGIFAKHANIKVRFSDPFFRNITLGLDLADVNFVKGHAKDAGLYDTLSGLVSVPFESRWQYKKISGSIRTKRDGTELKDFKAASEDIRLAFSGDVYNDDTIKFDIAIYFSGTVTAKIPEELSGVILTREPDGWSGLVVRLEGDYKTPAIQVSSKLFRLNIKALSSQAA